MRTTIPVAGRSRSYVAVGDAGGPPNRPLILVFHGSRQDAEKHRAFSGRLLDRLASDDRAVVVYLDGYRGNWNDARRESSFPARRDQIDDVAFTRAVVDAVADSHRIDRTRVIGVGYSNGGQMIFRLMHEAPDVLAGAVVIAAAMPDRGGFLFPYEDAARHSVPVALVGGTADPITPYDGGRMAWWARTLFRVGGSSLSVPDTARYFARRNRITDAPSVDELPARTTSERRTRVTVTRYRQPDRVPVTLYTVVGGGHTIPGAAGAPAIVGRAASDISIDEIVDDVLTTVAAGGRG